MQVQGQISLAIAAAMVLAFLWLSSEQYGLLLIGLGLLALGMVIRAGVEGELRWGRLRTRFFSHPAAEEALVTAEGQTLDHTMHRVFPL